MATLSGLTMQELETLSSKAIAAKANAYCEYIAGANVENVAYPVGTCAERVAFGTAVAAGHQDFKAVAVATDITPGASPCGMCRQFMREFTPPSFPVFMYDGQGNYAVRTMGELLPDSFGPDDLPH